ncbi:MAG: transglutaminase-like domain-containing protein [Candidatus Saccharimonadales bacterium]
MKIKLTALIGALVFIVGLAAPVTVVAASEDFDFSINHQFEVSDSTVGVRHDIEVNNKSQTGLETVEFALPVGVASDITVRYGDGANIPFSSVLKSSSSGGVEFEHTSLVLDFPRTNDGLNKSWNFTVAYSTSEGRHINGESRVLLWPFLDGRLQAEWSATVDVPQEWPLLNYQPELDITTVGSDTQFRFNGSDYPGDVLGLSFGADMLHTLSYSQRLSNRSLLPRVMSVILPLDLHSQSVQLEDLSPRPNRMRVDGDGNVIAYYRLWPFQSKTVSYSAQVSSRQLRYDTTKAGDITTTPDDLRDYTLGGKYWSTQGTAGEQATQLIDTETNAWNNILRIVTYVQDEVRYNPELTARLSADKVLEAGEGNAENLADTLLTMLRSQGIAARLIYGPVLPSTGLSDEAKFHTWVEAYVPEAGWVHLDPIWARLFGSSGSISSDRIGFLSVSHDDQSGLYHSLADTIRIAPAETALEETAPADLLDLSAERYVVLPGLMFDTQRVENRSGRIVDDVTLEDTALGSLAPLQSLSVRSWQLGGWSPQTITATVGELEFSSQAGVNWWPFGVLCLTAILAAAVWYHLLRRKQYLHRRLGHHSF